MLNKRSRNLEVGYTLSSDVHLLLIGQMTLGSVGKEAVLNSVPELISSIVILKLSFNVIVSTSLFRPVNKSFGEVSSPCML